MLPILQANTELAELIQKATTAENELNTIQSTLAEIDRNLEKNRALIGALQAENKVLEEKSNRVNVTELGGVDFKEFDDYSDGIFKNERKIKKLEEVINEFEKRKELIILTDFGKAERTTRALFKAVYSKAGEILLEEFLSSKEQELSRIFSLLSFGEINDSYIKHNIIADKLTRVMIYDYANISAVAKYPEFKYHSRGNEIGSGWRAKIRAEELKRELSALNNPTA